MLKLSKKTEYALLAVKYIALHTQNNSYSNMSESACITAKEISVSYNIPFDLLCKILQRLAKRKVIVSFQGVKGGYSLARNPKDITLRDIISSIEKTEITDCMKDNGSAIDCARFDCCQIRNPLSKIQDEINKVFNSTTVFQIL